MQCLIIELLVPIYNLFEMWYLPTYGNIYSIFFVVDKFDNEPFQAQFMVLKPDLNFQCPLYILSMEAKYDIKVSAFSSDDELFTPPASTFQIVAMFTCTLFLIQFMKTILNQFHMCLFKALEFILE